MYIHIPYIYVYMKYYSNYPREARRHQNTKQIGEAAGNIAPAGFRRGNLIRGDNTYINIYINKYTNSSFRQDTRQRRGAREVALMRRAIEASTSILDSTLLDNPNPNMYMK